jgi:hypothetical protein
MHESEFTGGVESPIAPADIADVGLLFVHGIGYHEAGATLQHMGNSLATYVQRRFAFQPDVRVRIETDGTSLGPEDVVNLTIETRGGPALWRMGEARWDGSFAEPTVGDVVRWGLVVAPWILHREAFWWWGRHGRLGLSGGVRRFFTSLFSFVLRFLGFTLAGVALQVLVLVSLAFMWLRPVRHMLDAILVRSAGDAYRFINDPEALAAMSMIVAQKLRHLCASCGSVVVIAHSQGAAVARAALEVADPPTNFKRLITLGPGLTKLHALQELAHRAGFLTYWTILRAVIFILFVSTLGGGTESTYASLNAILLLLLILAPMRGAARAQRRTKVAVARTTGLGIRWTWLDLWSARDLVPDGSLRVGRLNAEHVVMSLRVDNSTSWIKDHVTYVRNAGQVLPLIYGVAAQLSALDDPALVRDLGWTWQQRRRRAQARSRGFLVAAAVGVIPFGLLPALLDSELAYLTLPASTVVALVIWSRLWRKWDRRCRELEPRGCTVPFGWRKFMRIAFWRTLPAVPSPPDLGRDVAHDRLSWLRRALMGPPLDAGAYSEIASRSRSYRIDPHIVVMSATLMCLMALALIATPILVDTVIALSRRDVGTSPTQLITNALLDRRVVLLALGMVVLPAILLDALGELSGSGLRQTALRRLSAATLVAALITAAPVVGAGVIVSLTMRPIGTLAVGDCFDTNATNPSRPAGDQYHLEVLGIPCRELHEAEMFAVHKIDKNDFPGQVELEELATHACLTALPATAAGRTPPELSVNAYLPRSPNALRLAAGIYCFVASSRCHSALLGRVNQDLQIQPRLERLDGCSADSSMGDTGIEPEPAGASESFRRIYLGPAGIS